jgi:hypothetical protein
MTLQDILEGVYPMYNRQLDMFQDLLPTWADMVGGDLEWPLGAG